MPDPNIKILYKETYLKAVENSVGSKVFNSLVVQFRDTNEVKDILLDGIYSCAFFVSSILYLVNAIDKPHATVKRLLETFEKGEKWKKVAINDLEAGDVIFWENIKFDDGSENAHVGFALNKEEAVSTDYKNKVVTKHPIISESKRKIDVVYRYTW